MPRSAPSPPSAMAASAEFVTELTRHQRQLHAFILTMVWDFEEADDLLQETNLALWRKADEFDATRDFLPWAMQFARFQVKAWLKRRQRVPPAFNDAAIDRLMHRSIDAAAQDDARRSALEDCLQRLPDAQRRLLAKRYSPDVSVAEMAREQGMNPAALSQALRRIRIALLTCIERKLSGAAT